MLDTLDPHSYFLDPESSLRFNEEYTGKYYGLGIQIQKQEDRLVVVAPIEGTPAWRLGIQPGDVMVMYSNGVVEAEDEFKKQFGIERLINLVIKNRGHSAPEILAAVEKELLDYALPSASDLTLIILKRD